MRKISISANIGLNSWKNDKNINFGMYIQKKYTKKKRNFKIDFNFCSKYDHSEIKLL